MAVKRLSEIALAPSPPALTDTVVGVGSGTTDYQYTLAQVQSSVARTKLLSDTNFYVAMTGSDSNPGTISSPWATLQHAIDVTSSQYDFGGKNVFINVGAGSFVGAGMKSTVGGGTLSIIGAGSASTIITEGPNDGLFNIGDCIDFEVDTPSGPVYFNKLTFLPSLNLAAIVIAVPGVLVLLGDVLNVAAIDIVWDATNAPFVFIQVANYSLFVDYNFLNPAGSNTIKGASQTIFSVLFHSIGAHQGGSNWTVSGALTVTTFAYLFGVGSYIRAVNTQTFTGAGVVGSRYNIIGSSSVVDANGAGRLPANFFPGNADGMVDASSSYDGFIGAVSGAGLPTTTQFPDHGTGGLYKDTSGGGVYSVYNDAGTIKKVALT